MDNHSCASSGDSELGRVSSGWINVPVLPLEFLFWSGVLRMDNHSCASSGNSELLGCPED